MTVNFTEYITYFENIAKNLKAIGHTDEEKHFFSIEEEEALLGLANSIKYPAMILEGYDFKFTDQDSDNVLKGRMGAFTVYKQSNDLNDTEKTYQIYEDVEEIIDDIINLIREHKEARAHPIVTDFDFRSIQALRINSLEIGIGIRVSFEIHSVHNPAVDNDKWIKTNF